ncbi:Icc Predicted phosphohydrolases [Rhabdaerophilaceae bacterium]
MTFMIAHITDTHLSGEKPFFNRNFELVAAHLRAAAPDLVINTGDVALNGADLIEDLRVARSMHDGLGLAWRAIPGNHDVGDNQEIAKKQPANAERRARWLETFGPDFWTQEAPGWRLLGINSLLLGSDIPQAIEQEAFIAETARNLGASKLALFLHKPLFLNTLDDSDFGSHAVNPAPRARLLAALGDVRPALICCGHLHEYREETHEGMHQIWAPAISFTLSDWFLPPHGGVHMVGYVKLELNEDGTFTSMLVQPEGLVAHDLVDFPEAYGDLRAIKAQADAKKNAAAAQ